MLNYKTAIAAAMAFAFAVQANAENNNVEIMLADDLGDTRGYCLDVAGGQGKNAPVKNGLQAHTCYHYKGEILEDQGFDQTLIKKGTFFIPYFDVCMSVPSVETGAAITLSKCGDTDTQKFALNSNGQLASQANPELCITVSSTQEKQGRGGSPVHVMRPVSLQACDDSNKTYQTWTIHSL